MNKIKSNLQNMVLVLTGSALICGGLLAYINNLTKPTIEAQAEKTLNEGISAVLGGNAGERLEEPTTVKRTVDGKEQTFVVYKMQNGTAVQSTDPNAFGGNLKVLVGFNTEGDILGYTVLEHAETPGLGAKAGEWFQKGQPGCIVGLNPGEKNLTVSKDGGDIELIDVEDNKVYIKLTGKCHVCKNAKLTFAFVQTALREHINPEIEVIRV